MSKGKNTKTHYMYVTPKDDPFNVIVRKAFFTADEKNAWLKQAEEDYPATEFKIWHDYR